MTTERLVLRPLTPLDAESLLQALDPEVVSWQGYPTDPAALEDLVRGWCDGRYKAMWNWAICDRSSGQLIGHRQLIARTDAEFRGRVCKTGSSITAGWRDKGYGTEELWAIVRLITDHVGFSIVFAQSGVDNVRARRVYEKCGFEEVGVEKDHALPDGSTVEAVWLRRVERADRTCRYAIRPPRWGSK